VSHRPDRAVADAPRRAASGGERQRAGASPVPVTDAVAPAGKPHKNAKRAKISLLRRLPLLLKALRRSALPDDRLPHARFCHTRFGVRSLVVAGSGSPTVVFEAGVGQDKRHWAQVFNRISELTRAVAYDRAGYGQSEPSALPRDGLQLVLELRDLLRTEGILPPYVLVGHSLGGTMVKLFAKTWPDEVAGVVLCDARHEEFTQRCRQQGVSRLLYDPPEAFLNRLPAVPRAEVLAAPLTLKQARRAGSFPDVPLIVLTQGNATSRWPAALGKVWAAGQRRMATMSALGRIKVVGDVGHNLHLERPDVVARAVTGVVRAARVIRGRSLRRMRAQGAR